MLIASLVIAGAIGAPTRYLLDGFVQSRVRGVFPWGTFTINVSGSSILGIVTGWALYHGLGDIPRSRDRHRLLRSLHHVLDVLVRDRSAPRRGIRVRVGLERDRQRRRRARSGWSWSRVDGALLMNTPGEVSDPDPTRGAVLYGSFHVQGDVA